MYENTSSLNLSVPHLCKSTPQEKAEFFCEGLEGVEELDDNDLGFQARDAGMSTFSCLKGRVVCELLLYTCRMFLARYSCIHYDFTTKGKR